MQNSNPQPRDAAVTHLLLSCCLCQRGNYFLYPWQLFLLSMAHLCNKTISSEIGKKFWPNNVKEQLQPKGCCCHPSCSQLLLLSAWQCVLLIMAHLLQCCCVNLTTAYAPKQNTGNAKCAHASKRYNLQSDTIGLLRMLASSWNIKLKHMQVCKECITQRGTRYYPYTPMEQNKKLQAFSESHCA